MSEDHQLDRLYDYTKFHIAIYLGFSSGLVALIGKASDIVFLKSLVAMPAAIIVSFAFMVAAGISGAIVATSTIESKSYAEFIGQKHGVYGIKPLTGKAWVTLEHLFFWLSLGALAAGILSKRSVWLWAFGA